MNVKKNLVGESYSILNSALIFIPVLVLLNTLHSRWVLEPLALFTLLLAIPAKIFILGGIYGCLVELISEEELYLKFSNFKDNAKRFWFIYFALAAATLFGHMVLSVGRIVSSQFTINHAFVHLSLIFAYILSAYIIKHKYGIPLNLKRKKIHLNPAEIATITGLHFLQLTLLYLPSYVYAPNFDLPAIMLVCSIYLNLFLFVCITRILLNQHPEIEKHFEHDKEIYFVNPLGGGVFYYISSMFMPHRTPAFIVLKALTPKTFFSREFTFRTWRKRYYRSNKLVAITCFTSNCCDAYKIAREFKKKGSKVIIGGPHVTYMADEALEYCDSVVVGEAEGVWQDIIADYEHGRLKKRYTGMARDDCHDLVHQELLNSSPEIIKDFLETSRGCKFKCRFCSVPNLSDGKVRTKPIFDLVELLMKVKTKYNNVTFIDNNIYNDPTYARELFKAIKPLKMKWSTQCTIDIGKNEETLRLARESGCNGLLIGFEISEGSFEKVHGGKFAMVDNYKLYAKKIRGLGIKIKAHFIFGFETDRLSNLFRFWRFCFSIRPFITILSILTPFPGTKIYDDMISEDRITNLSWRNYGCQTLVFKHDYINHFILSKFWPLIYIFFFITTSRIGHLYILLTLMYSSSYLIKFL